MWALVAPTTPVALSWTVIAVIVVAAAALSIPRATWRWFGLVTTLVHELGHASAALLTGRVVRGIRIRADQSGEMLSAGVRGHVLSGIAGYPAPAIVGTLLMWAVTQGWQAPALAIIAVALVLSLLVIRNAVGLGIVVGSLAASVALLLFATPEWQAWSLLAVGLALLVGAWRGLGAVLAVHARRRDLQSSDAWLLARRTGIPSFVWLFVFIVVIAGSTALAAWTLASDLGVNPLVE
ncbi:M50 family peptidase [Agromyces sp. MMS17-SY077]|uniref:M50 family peptidase n=1 Tax=Agromyces seonyuensis TaxID=2662446 RepID=A0A6I4NV13_9MICO|nr:M50 family peptidase [Agromyces seonyuensis]